MNTKKKFPVAMTRSETILGWLYLLVQIFVLPEGLARLNAMLPQPLSATGVNTVYFCVNFLCVIAIFKGYLKRSLDYTFKNFGKFLKGAVLGFALYRAVAFIVGYLLNWLFPSFSNVNDSTISAMVTESYVPMAVATIAMVPLTEELLYRGMLFQGFCGISKGAAYILSTAAFCAVHIMGYIGTADNLTLVLCVVQYIPAGLCLAWSFEEGDSIFVPVVIHLVVNALGIYGVR